MACITAQAESHWQFEKSVEEVLADEELIDSMLEEVMYDDIDAGNPDDVYYLLDKYLEVI